MKKISISDHQLTDSILGLVLLAEHYEKIANYTGLSFEDRKRYYKKVEPIKVLTESLKKKLYEPSF